MQITTWQDIRTRQSVPKFRALIRQGSAATGPYSRQNNNVVRVEAFGCTQSITFDSPNPLEKGKHYIESVDGLYPVTPPNLGTLIPNATIDALALTDCYKKLASNMSHANGLQFLGEFHEVITMFKRPYRGFIDLVNHYTLDVQKLNKKHRPKESSRGRKRFLNAVTDSWLATSFGLKPLISDVKDLAETAARFQFDKRRDNAVGKAGSPISATNPTSTNLGSMGTNYIIGFLREKTIVEHFVKYRAALDWSASGAFGSYSRLAELAGFRLDLFVPTIYELIPYSWLADYWSNLGTVITTGCQSQAAVKFVVKTTKVQATKESFIEVGTSPNIGPTGRVEFCIQLPGRIKQIRTSFERSASGQLPLVPFQFSIPGEKTKYANMLAVWAGRLKI